MLKILYVNTYYDPNFGGGAEITLKTLVEGMKEQGHDVVVLCLTADKNNTEETVNGVRVIRVNLENYYWPLQKTKRSPVKKILWHLRDAYNISMAKKFGEIVKQESPDLVSCHNLAGWSSLVWSELGKLKMPFVQVLHDFYSVCPNSNMFNGSASCESPCFRCKAFRLGHARLSSAASAVVGVSEYILNKHLALGYFDGVKIAKSIKNARNIDVPQARNSIENEGLTFGFIGTLVPAKGIEYLIREFSNAALLNAKLLVAGKGEDSYAEHLKSISPDSVTFLGQVEPNTFYPQIDILVVPSLWQEGLGMVVAEAFAYSVPVIGSRRGGIPEMIVEGHNGYLFEPSEGLLTKLLLNIERRDNSFSEMRRAAYLDSKVFTDVASWTRNYELVYNDII